MANSENLDTVCSRYKDMLNFGNRIVQATQGQQHDEELTMFYQSYEEMQTQKVDIFNAAVERAIHKLEIKLNSLKTQKGKANNINKFKEQLNQLEGIPDASKSYALSLLESIIVGKHDENIPICLSTIPPSILDLLWFIDGPLANYANHKEQKLIKFKECQVKVLLSTDPSAISLLLPIGTPLTPAPSIGYYPSYERLTPDERATYIHWLSNPEASIDIGYVFIFYYGLERYLFLREDKYEEAFNMIIHLRKYHDNSSFQNYSLDALLSACVLWNRADLFEKLLPEINSNISIMTLACMAKFNMPLSIDNIIQMAYAVGFNNRRYIKNEPDLFRENLKGLLTENFSTPEYPLTDSLLKDCPQTRCLICANHSLQFRNQKLPDLLQCKKFKTDLYNLLSATHEKTKIDLRERRRKEKENK